MAATEAIVTALLSGVAGGRAYPQFRPQNGTLPAVVWSIISTTPQGVLSQSSGGGLWSARVQIDCIESNYSACKALMDNVRAAVHLKSGTYGGKTVVSSVIDQFGSDAVDIDAQLYIQPVDIIITFYD
jgi:hypothetical protein